MWIILIVISTGVIAILSLPYMLITRTELPQPSGKWPVGTQDINWDTFDRSQTDILAKVWYPTNDQSSKSSNYIDRLGRVFADIATMNLLYKLIFWLLRHVTTSPASIDAMPIDDPDGLPVILFSPGFGGINYLGTFYALEFASHGFIVVGINHPGSSASTMLTDGSQIGITQEVLDAFSDPDLMISKLVINQADNISLVLEQVINLNSTLDSLLYQKINVNKIFAAGHSLGGSASFLACCQDQRISRSINFDGYFFIDGIDIDRVASQDENCIPKNFLLILSDRLIPEKSKTPNKFDLMMAKDREKIDQLADNKNFNTILLNTASHVNFSDLPLIIKPAFSKALRIFRGTDGRKTLAETSTMAINFLNR